MKPYYKDDWLELWGGDCLDVLREMPADSVDCVVTSPPYWGLRDYGTATWESGDAECDHMKPIVGRNASSTLNAARNADGTLTGKAQPSGTQQYAQVCGKCGATRIDSQLGLERTPEEYVANMVNVFREVRRVLKPSGTCWLNLGDSYAGSGKGPEGNLNKGETFRHLEHKSGGIVPSGLKPKDLVGIPWLVARALQEPYYTGRIAKERDRVWLAAMVDGEGTICGFDHDRADGGGHRSGVHVTITNSSTALLDEAARIWPTSRSEHERPGAGHLGQRQTWRWIVHGIANKQAVLRELYPHLIAKRQQAVAAYTLLDLMANAKRLGHSPQKDAVIAKRAVLTQLLSDLNKQREIVMPSWLIEPPSLFEPGWYLRSDIIWSKPNPMPESVTDRPTKSHEYLFLLTKSPRYYFDADAVREPHSDKTVFTYPITGGKAVEGHAGANSPTSTLRVENPAGRNIRSVWNIATRPYPGAHFAVFPPELPERCIKAGSSEKGVCPECGAPWRRETVRATTPPSYRKGNRPETTHAVHGPSDTRTLGMVQQIETVRWEPTCGGHYDPDNGHGTTLDPIPAVILDPFGGSGTVGMVANRLSRRAILIDLNPEYLKQQMKRNAQTPLGLDAA